MEYFNFNDFAKKTIVGPITGSNLKTNIIYILLKHIGIFLLKKKIINFIFSQSIRKYFKNNKNVYYNFMLYNFKFKKKFYKKKYLTSLFILEKIKIKIFIN